MTKAKRPSITEKKPFVPPYANQKSENKTVILSYATVMCQASKGITCKYLHINY